MKDAIIHKFQLMLFDTRSETGTSLISPIVNVQHPAGQRLRVASPAPLYESQRYSLWINLS
jgi:hypothetical protein